VGHWTQRYGTAEVASWYFEVWNEPNLKDGFFTGTQQDYFKLYKETAQAIKSVSKSYRVGGPATAGNAWIPEMIDYCIKEKAPIDFISTHDYGVNQGFLDETGNAGTVLSNERNHIANDMRKSRQQIKASPMPNLELHYTEWSASYTPADPIHDSYHEAAYILNTVKKALPYVNSMSYWTFTDIFEESGIRTTPFHGGFGLMNYQDIKKPAFYAFKYLNELGNTALTCSDSSALVSKDKTGNVQALLWDFTIDHPGDSVNNQVFYKRNLPAKPSSTVNLNISGLSAGKYTLSVYKTGYNANDPYTAYFEMGSPSQLTIPQVKTLKQLSSDNPVQKLVIEVGANGTFKRNWNLRQNDVMLVKLDRLKK
jgi:xylan 1,4-beta-xylosidase